MCSKDGGMSTADTVADGGQDVSTPLELLEDESEGELTELNQGS